MAGKMVETRKITSEYLLTGLVDHAFSDVDTSSGEAIGSRIPVEHAPQRRRA